MNGILEIPEERFTTARDFIRALMISDEKWLPQDDMIWNSPWIFRGQMQSKWALTPKAWRNDDTPELKTLRKIKSKYLEWNTCIIEREVKTHILNKMDHHPNVMNTASESYFQGIAECNMIREFIEIANTVGHPIPGAEDYRKDLLGAICEQAPKYPSFSFVIKPNSITALAQHHGIPTRLLDWSYNPLVAAFFAAEGVEETDDGDIAVWAINRVIFNVGDYYKKKLKPFNGFAELECARNENMFLYAQEGLFIYPVDGCAYYALNGKWPALEEYAIDAYNNNINNMSAIGVICLSDVIRKLVMPHKCVDELVRLLWANGISRSHLMPTYDNIIKSIITKTKWKFR
jgi:hypothetical protein